MYYGYCQEPRVLTTAGAGRNFGAIKLEAAQTMQYQGNKVTAIGVVTGRNTNDEKNHIKDVTVFLTRSLDEEPLFVATGQYTAEPGGWNYIDLGGEFLLDGETDFYIGYWFDAPVDDDLGLIFDGGYPWPGLGNLIASGDDLSTAEWGEAPSSLEDNVGALCIRAKVEGSNLPHDKLDISMKWLPTFVKKGEPFESKINVWNTGLNEISSIDVELKIADEEVQHRTVTFESPLSYQGGNTFTIPDFVCNTEGNNIPYTLSLTNINGSRENLSVTGSISSTFLCLKEGEGYRRNLLLEEGTGTWCGYCPQGIVGIDYMKEKYADGTFIPVAMHLSNGDAPDPFDVLGLFAENPEEYCYNPMKDHIFFAPSSYMNREYNGNASIFTAASGIEEAYLARIDNPAFASISAEAFWLTGDKRRLNVKTKVSFAASEENTNYKIGYIVTEDHVGPEFQTNNYADGACGEMGGWENKESHVLWYYDDVARNCSKPYGLENSIPTSIEKGKTYDFETTVELSDVDNVDNCHIIAIVVNENTEVVENAAYITSFTDHSGIEIPAYDDSEAVYFNLQGIKVVNPEAGTPLIRIKGGIAEKVIL